MQKEGLSLLEESSEEENENDTPEEDLMPLKKLNTIMVKSKRKKYYQEEQNSRRLGEFLTPENIESLIFLIFFGKNLILFKGLKKKTMIFNNLEVQTNFLNRISNMENLEESTTMNPTDLKLLKSVLIFFSK